MKKTALIHGALGVAMLGIRPLGAKQYGCHFHDKADDGKGGVTLTSEEKDALLGGVKSIKKTTDDLTANFDNLDKQTKDAFKELESLRDVGAKAEELGRSLQKVQLQLANERRMAFGAQSPIIRISADPEKRARFNAAIRMAVCNQNGDMQQLAKSILSKALGEDTSPGSTLIDDELATDIYDTLAMYGIWNTFRVQRLGTKTTKFPVKTVRTAAGWLLTEGDPIPDDTAKAGTSVDLTVEVLAVLLNVSLQLIQDSAFDITADVLNDFAEAFAYVLDFACLQADGGADATDGNNTGIFAGGTAAVASDGNTTVEALDLEDVIRVLTAVDAQVLSRPARWWIHPQILVRMLAIRDQNGRSIFLTANEAPANGAIGSILGYPVTLAHAAPSTNAASAKVAAFGDPNALVVGIRQDFTFEASDHHKWNTLQRSFRGYGRAGVKIRKASAFGVLTLPAN
jgi:HK97 family phage major capsid protein